MDLATGIDVAQLQRLLDDNAGFARVYGFQITAIAAGECTLRIPFDAAHERPGGVVSGPVYMAAADVAMWLAIKTLQGIHDSSLTVGLDTQFLSAARREDFACMARVLNISGRDSFGTAQCRALDGRLLSHHTLRYRRPSAR